RRLTASQQLAPHTRELLVPGVQNGPKPRGTQPLLEQMVSASHDLAVSAPHGQMRGKELSGKSVDEITPRLRRPMEDRRIVPPERNHARPRATFAGHGPGAIVASLDDSPKPTRTFA